MSIGMSALNLERFTQLMLDSRTPWRGDEDLVKKIKTQGQVNREGYVNVASELGLSGFRGKLPPLVLQGKFM